MNTMLADVLVREMGAANDVNFAVTKEQREALAAALTGVSLTQEEIELLTDGEETEREQRFKFCEWFADVDKLLEAIFNGPIEV